MRISDWSSDVCSSDLNAIEPPRQRDARSLHHLLGIEARDQIVVVDLPDARPVFPGAFRQAVIERQGDDIEPDVRRTLHVVVAANDVGAGAGLADIAIGRASCWERGGQYVLFLVVAVLFKKKNITY